MNEELLVERDGFQTQVALFAYYTILNKFQANIVEARLRQTQDEMAEINIILTKKARREFESRRDAEVLFIYSIFSNLM